MRWSQYSYWLTPNIIIEWEGKKQKSKYNVHKACKINALQTNNEVRSNRKWTLMWLGNNPMVGATVAVAVSVEEAANAGKF